MRQHALFFVPSAVLRSYVSLYLNVSISVLPLLIGLYVSLLLVCITQCVPLPSLLFCPSIYLPIHHVYLSKY